MTGEVISGETRDPLLGVNIAVQNTDIGTTTDLYGQYVLEGISPQDILVFTYIGYQDEEVAIDGRGVIDLVLTPQALSGEDVVVIGYGTMQRRDITSSIFSLKEGSFTQGNNTDLQSMLQGRVPGVVITSSNGDIGAAPLIRIRGGTSISAGNGPLIVIDGVPIDYSSGTPDGVTGGQEVTGGNRDNPLSMVNPYDIASIDILKDASAAAIYGARGGNGVILITTKTGKVGAGGSALTYNTYTSYATQSKKLDLLSASEYKAYAQRVADARVIIEQDDDTTKYYEYIGTNFGSDDTDWQDAIVRTARTTSHDVAFSAATDLTQYRISLNYLDEQGIVLGSERQRISARLNINHKMLNEKLRLAVRINPTYIVQANVPYQQSAGFQGGVFSNVFKQNPTRPLYDTTGAYFEHPTSNTIRNPVALANEIDDTTEKLRIFANATAEYEIVPGLSAKINLGLDRTNATRFIYQPSSLPYMAEIGGRADLRENQNQSVLFESTLNYKADLGDSRIETWAGYTYQEFEIQGFGTSAEGFVVDTWKFNNLSGASSFPTRPYSFKEDNRLVSFLGRVNYNMADKFLLSAALRREGSSRFGADTKWGIFPSGSAGFRITDDLKVRASWGVTGNQDIGNYRSLVFLGSGDNAVIGSELLTGVGPTQLANRDLKWEETSQLNLGVDFNLYRDRLSGSVDVYSKTTKDLLLELTLPQPAVAPTGLFNVGTVENKGLEVTLTTVNVSTPDFFWRTSFNFAVNRNEVISLGTATAEILTGRVSGAGLSGVDAQVIRPGEPLGTFYGFQFSGYDSLGEEILTNGVWDSGESFTDLNNNGIWDVAETLLTDYNSNGVWDDDEEYTDLGDGAGGAPNGVWDVGEPFVDTPDDPNSSLDNGVYDEGEVFTDLNGNGVWDGDPLKDSNGNGIWDAADTFTDTDGDGVWNKAEPLDERRIIGNAQPSFTWGISNTITYGNLDFSFYINGVQGVDIFNNTAMEYQRPSNITNGINLLSGALDDVDDGMGYLASVRFSDRWIEDGSFIRLQNVTLGYTFNTDRFNKLRLYVSADNLFVLTKYTGYDPEINTFASGTVPSLGIDYTNYPRARTFTVGLNIGL
ncbi:MAG: SusC/RagA family TonB-linked outer membrane protein [Candidatus Marinimicrobia bacterium]|nr:SusC/RagA family TonB-linked outer membrane protein [Candidatus Neomarinimicrobiota bacterium]